MGQALVFGLLGSSALVIGGALGAYWRVPHQVSGVLLAFASGTLISALAFELFPEAVHLGGLWPAGLGLIAGGLTFVVINTTLDSWVARSAGDPHEVQALSSEAADDVSGAEAQQTERVQEAAATRQAGRAAVGFALLAAVTLDGVPENLALGVSLLSGGGSLALLVAIFCSNFPESLVGAVAMRRGGARLRLRSGSGLSPRCCSPPQWSSVGGCSPGFPRSTWPSRSPSQAARSWPRWPTPSCPRHSSTAGRSTRWRRRPGSWCRSSSAAEAFGRYGRRVAALGALGAGDGPSERADY
jgi:zinc transporter ZupT